MSLQQQEIRPFGSVTALDELMSGMSLIVEGQRVDPDGSLILDEDVYLRSGVGLRLAADQKTLKSLIADLQDTNGRAALESLGVTIEDLEFVVLATSWFLRIVDIVERRPLADLANGPLTIEISADPRPDSLRSPNAGCEIDVMVCLARARPRLPLRPWRRGTWLARTSFGLSTAESLSGFTPKPMDSAKKVELGIPPNATRYITMGVDSPLDESTGEDSLEMWVDADVLAKMSAMPRSAASKALQGQLFVDAVAAVVRSVRGVPGDEDVPKIDSCSWSDVEKSLMGRMITALAPAKGDREARVRAYENLLATLRTDPARFIAHAEQAAGTSVSFENLLEA